MDRSNLELYILYYNTQRNILSTPLHMTYPKLQLSHVILCTSVIYNETPEVTYTSENFINLISGLNL